MSIRYVVSVEVIYNMEVYPFQDPGIRLLKNE